MTLVEFLRARLDEDENEARAAQDVRSDYHRWHQVADLEQLGFDDRDSLLITSCSPVRVLREVEAKRRMLEFHDRAHPHDDDPCTVQLLLVLPYADHDDYREEWRI